MGNKLFVSGLPYEMTDEGLRAMFDEVGTVTSATVVQDRFSGRSRGFGFVEMSTNEEALRAIQQFNGRKVDGRTLTVNEARPREPREAGTGRGGPSRGGGMDQRRGRHR